MARRQVIEIECSRCGRGEIQTENELSGIDENAPEFSVTYHGKTITYADLCTRCRKALHNYYLRVTNTEERSKKNPADSEDVQKRGGLLSLGKK